MNLSQKDYFNLNHPLMVQEGIYSYNIPAHTHDFMEIALVLDGHAVHVTQWGKHPIQQGDIIIMDNRTWHAYENCQHLRIINCCFDRTLLYNQLSWLRSQRKFYHLLWLPPSYSQNKLIRLDLNEQLKISYDILQQLKRILAKNPNQAQVIGYLTALVGTLADNISLDDDLIDTSSRVKEALFYIQNHFAQDWSVDDLAANLHTSPAHLRRLFKHNVGMSIGQYQRHCRIQHAIYQLCYSMATIGEIGAHVGWFDQNYFSRCFRQYTGLSPSEYRAKHGRAFSGL